MRILLALLAVLSLLASPMSAAAAQLACSQMTMSMSSASMSGADASGLTGMQSGGVEKAGAPCCSHGEKSPAKSCAQLCAAACAVSDALAAPVLSAPFILKATAHAPAPVVSVHPFEPNGAERPPRPIA